MLYEVEKMVNYWKIHVTHIIVSLEWVGGLLGQFGIMGFYHMPFTVWTFLVDLAFTMPNGYFLSKWAFSENSQGVEVTASSEKN